MEPMIGLYLALLLPSWAALGVLMAHWARRRRPIPVSLYRS